MSDLVKNARKLAGKLKKFLRPDDFDLLNNLADKVERLNRALETVEEALEFTIDNNGIERIEASEVIVGYVKHCPDLASWLRGREK